MDGKFKYLFGPVPSRRLGRSLGVDLTPFKTCNYNCIFCQLGVTTCQTTERKPYVPIEEVEEELRRWFVIDGQADQITLAGSGEPTLHAEFGRIIDFVRANSKIPVTLLTNGAAMINPQVRAAASHADTVKLSLSAWDDESYRLINRPCSGMTFESLVEGEKRFRQEFTGRLLLEVFLLEGINDNPRAIKKIAEYAAQIRPDQVQLNTSVRPAAEEMARLVSRDRMLEFTAFFDPPAEVIANFSSKGQVEVQINEEAILDMIRRRPCTMAQIAEVFAMHPNHASKYLGKLLSSGKITAIRRNQETFYFLESEKTVD